MNTLTIKENFDITTPVIEIVVGCAYNRLINGSVRLFYGVFEGEWKNFSHTLIKSNEMSFSDVSEGVDKFIDNIMKDIFKINKNTTIKLCIGKHSEKYNGAVKNYYKFSTEISLDKITTDIDKKILIEFLRLLFTYEKMDGLVKNGKQYFPEWECAQ